MRRRQGCCGTIWLRSLLTLRFAQGPAAVTCHHAAHTAHGCLAFQRDGLTSWTLHGGGGGGCRCRFISICLHSKNPLTHRTGVEALPVTRTHQLRCESFENSIFNTCESVVSESGTVVQYRRRSLKAPPGALEFSSEAEAWCQTGLVSFPPGIRVSALLVKNILSFLFPPGVGATPFSSNPSPNMLKVQQSAMFQQAAEDRGLILLLPVDPEQFLEQLTGRCCFASSPGRKNKTPPE